MLVKGEKNSAQLGIQSTRTFDSLIDFWGKYIVTRKMGTISKIEMSGSRAVRNSGGHERRGFFG